MKPTNQSAVMRSVCVQMKAEVVREVAYCRRKQHQAAMQYYCSLNALQYRKRVAMLEPMLGYTRAQVRHPTNHNRSSLLTLPTSDWLVHRAVVSLYAHVQFI